MSDPAIPATDSRRRGPLSYLVAFSSGDRQTVFLE
jgi:hypothetical protein